MMEISDINVYSQSDSEILRTIGEFVKASRIAKSLTQHELASQASINRSTLVNLEKGSSVNLISLIQVLRILKKLDVLERMKVSSQVSPIKVAQIQLKSPVRVRSDFAKKARLNRRNKSDW